MLSGVDVVSMLVVWSCPSVYGVQVVIVLFVVFICALAALSCFLIFFSCRCSRTCTCNILGFDALMFIMCVAVVLLSLLLLLVVVNVGNCHSLLILIRSIVLVPSRSVALSAVWW